MLDLPWDVLTSGVLVHLSIRDLQAVNVAFTSTRTHRAQIKEFWKSYSYECPDDVTVSVDDLVWLKSVDAKPVGLVILFGRSRLDFSESVHIASNFPTLRKFQAQGTFDCRYNDASLIKLAQSCPLLEVLHIPCSSVTDAGILALAQNCRQLHTLDICYFTKVYQRVIHDSAFALLCSHYAHLKHIGLSNCHNLTDASLIAMADSYPHLESINLRYLNFTDDGLIYIADKCHELRSVSVACYNITSRGLTALWAANPNLMDVNISFNNFISDNDVIQLGQCCPLLQKLIISECYHITDAAVIVVAEHCPQLRLFNIRHCYDLSDASLIALGQHCHELKSIDISSLRNISDVGIAALAAGCPLLQEFYASDTNITDAGVIALARGCRDLRKVNLNGCIQIDTYGVSAIAEKCPLISEFYLSSNERINDACIYVIAQHCRNLIYLSVDRHKISSESVQAVYRRCRNVRIFT